MSQKLLTYKDLAERWQKSVGTLRYWVMEKKLKPLKLRRAVRFKESYILECEEKGIR
jgi:hypothetical protein